MRRATLLVFSVLSLLTASTACSSSSTDDGDVSGEDALTNKNLTAGNFGLTKGEIALTLDDGPGERTVELVTWLADEGIPVTLFEVGKNAKANPTAVQKIVEIAKAHPQVQIIIGNHSMTHTTPLPKQGVDGSIAEVMNADAILKDAIAASQSSFAKPTPFFRPPYGAFTALGGAGIDKVNAAGASKYTGPVFWDIGGELSDKFSADWACWGKVTMDRCIDGYIAEARTRGRGVMLAHDVHSMTVDMLTGKGAANGRSLIRELKKLGFKFVSLRSHEAAVQTFAKEQDRLAASTAASIVAKATPKDDGTVDLDVEQTGAARVKVIFDTNDAAATSFSDPQKTITQKLSPGSHFVSILALDGANNVLKAEKIPFVMPGEILPDSLEAKEDRKPEAACVNFDLMKAGQRYRLYHGKVACDAPGAVSVPCVPNECYRFKGELMTTRDPKLVGAGDWSMEFDLSYKADENDKSKVTMVMDSSSGEIETGKRHQWTIRGVPKLDAGMSFSAAECRQGLWRGQFDYANGKHEDFLFRMVRDPLTGGAIHCAGGGEN
jgi:peptidoglycan/xylan/chitin deacetylase (PgdA/CDA1 family)